LNLFWRWAPPSLTSELGKCEENEPIDYKWMGRQNSVAWTYTMAHKSGLSIILVVPNL
jgi:hypothetical protein